MEADMVVVAREESAGCRAVTELGPVVDIVGSSQCVPWIVVVLMMGRAMGIRFCEAVVWVVYQGPWCRGFCRFV